LSGAFGHLTKTLHKKLTVISLRAARQRRHPQFRDRYVAGRINEPSCHPPLRREFTGFNPRRWIAVIFSVGPLFIPKDYEVNCNNESRVNKRRPLGISARMG
jgi:hypothetical protein